MTMSVTGPEASAPRAAPVRWSWLWGLKRDLAFNLLPFWLGFALVAALYLTRGSSGTDPTWSFTFSGREFSVMTVAFILYGPLVDGPHLWATIARTYTDSEEWAQRRRLFLTSLLAFAIGPALILLPYVVHAITPIPKHMLQWGFVAWGFSFGNYALYHINKQHWGFACLYRRKAGETDPRDARADALFFHTALWAPYFATLSAPWAHQTADGVPSAGMALAFSACHALFLTAVVAYACFQVVQWQRGVVRNGPKLVYVGTVASLYYLTFACDARIAEFWVLITGTGHCAQYHGVVWAYGKKRYADATGEARRLPHLIFGNVWLYVVLGLAFALFALQGPGANTFKNTAGALLQGSLFSRVFTFLDASEGRRLAVEVLTALIAGFRLHHFYVDSKIWRVSKNQTLAKNLSV